MTAAFVSIIDHGARSGTKCTAAIQAAIDHVHEGGGTVYVPPGIYQTGTLVLKSRVTLHVDPAAVLKGSGDLADYPRHPLANTHENDHYFLILAEDAEDITITGGGIIDGNGPAFWQPPQEGREWRVAKPERVIPMIELRRCTRVRIENVRVINSPGWTIHPFCCDDVTIRGLRLKNDVFGPNTDGIDIDGSRDVFISDCHLVCGDDAIIIKATPHARCTERVVITNCICMSNCIGIGIGQETESGIRQVAISNCAIYNSHRMFTIGIWNGGFVEDVTVSNIVGDTIAHYALARPIQIETKQHLTYTPVNPIGTIRNVNISNFVARTQGRILITAQDGAEIENVTLRDVRLQYVALENAEVLSPERGDQGSTQYANRNVEARKQNAALVMENCAGFDVDGFTVAWPEPGAPLTNPGGPHEAEREADPAYTAVWARRVRASRIHAPLVRASAAGHPVAIFAESDDSVFQVGDSQ